MALPDEGVFSRNDVYPSADTLMQVEEKTRESADLENTSNSVLNSILRKGSSGGTSPDASVSSTSFNFSFPSASSSSDGHKPTPSRRKFGAPSSIPNFPSANDARTPSSHRPVSHSPSQSPFRSPITTPTQQPSVPIAQTQPFVSPQNLNGPSPWVALAASSGAPTPSIEDGPSTSRASPHLGYPFERLNIGGSWSGANLWGASDGMQGRTSAESNTDKGSPKAAVHSTPSGLTPETLAKYRAKAGMLSSTNSRTKSQGLALDGVETDSDTTASSSSKIPVSTAKHRREDLVPDRSPRLISTPESDHDFLNPHPANPGTPSSGKLNSLTIISLRAMATRSTTLILDLRPPSAFLASHLPSSHSLPIPSTLLRRPAFNLQKLVQMLPSPSSEEVSKWRDRSDIVLIDLDSIAAPRGGVLDGLAGKFDREDFSGHLWFVRGGYKAVQSIDGMGVSSKHGNDDEGAHTATGPGRLMAGRLGKLAFLPGMSSRERERQISDARRIYQQRPKSKS